MAFRDPRFLAITHPPTPLAILRSCFKFIPRQIEIYVEADWSPRYAVNSGQLTKIKRFKSQTGAQSGRNIPACNDNIISL